MREGWETKKLGESFVTVTGNTPPKSNANYFGTFIPLVKPPELLDGPVEIAVDGLSEGGSKMARIAPPNSILVSCIGNLGKVGLNSAAVAFNQQINAILTDESKIVPKFLFYQVLSPLFKAQLAALSSGTTVPIVNKSKFNSIEIVLPPLPEQRRIVEILDGAFAAIATATAAAETNLQNARALFDSHLHAIFSQRGDGWAERQLSSLCRQITVGHVGSMKEKYRESGVPFLRSQNIRPFNVSMENIRYIDEDFNRTLKKSQLWPGDLAIVRTGYPGTAAVIPPELDVSNCSDLVIVRPGADVSPHFLAAFFNSTFGKQLVLGELVGAAQKHFNVKSAKEVRLHVPPMFKQRAIVANIFALLAETDRLAAIYERKLAALAELKQSLLHQAFTGQLTASPDAQLAEALA